MATNTVAETSPTTPADKVNDLCVVEIGEYSSKQIKKLRKGEGKLMNGIEKIIHDLKEDGVLTKDTNTVVLVVREEFSVRSMIDRD